MNPAQGFVPGVHYRLALHVLSGPTQFYCVSLAYGSYQHMIGSGLGNELQGASRDCVMHIENSDW